MISVTKTIFLGDTTFENCYNTFGCANDCDASLTKIKGSLSAKAGREIAVGDMTLEQMVEWAKELPYDSGMEFKSWTRNPDRPTRSELRPHLGQIAVCGALILNSWFSKRR